MHVCVCAHTRIRVAYIYEWQTSTSERSKEVRIRLGDLFKLQVVFVIILEGIYAGTTSTDSRSAFKDSVTIESKTFFIVLVLFNSDIRHTHNHPYTTYRPIPPPKGFRG